ncbi:hypothetical protein ATCV1_z645R [Acanthocystis turfacea chlorella virus 1]|uniref:Uncharacterized protein z645R n=1 Tax=Chlorovirus heliozoae TaxID=322019 RepID=A7K9Q5_9PHYC|nr:hypothetical protein ATCV1_z645R [Acanthocystis turfacea chlorella virus 1]ABT16779.1 hypothetical protein ATCV1_z645R [Acanthocystis turfacea chlorella virus 1]
MRVPKPSKQSYFRLRSVCIMHITKSPDVSHTAPLMREIVAPGTNFLILSSNCSARNSLCTRMRVFNPTLVAV